MEIQGVNEKENNFPYNKKSDPQSEISHPVSLITDEKRQVMKSINRTKTVPSVFQSTPVQRKTFQGRKLTDMFTKLPPSSASNVEKRRTRRESVSHRSLNENDAQQHGSSVSNKRSADVAPVHEVETEQRKQTAQTNPSTASNNIAGSSNLPSEKKRGTLKFYFYPVENAKKWIKDAQGKSKPHKKPPVKNLRIPATDELTEVLLWEGNSRKKRNLRDLTDLEVALTVVKQTVTDFRESINDQHSLQLIDKYKENFQQGIIEKLQSIEEDKRMQSKLNKLKKENKALSLKLGSLTDKRIRLQNEIRKRKSKHTE